MGIKVKAGDLDIGNWDFVYSVKDALMKRRSTAKHLFRGESYSLLSDLESVELLDEESVKKLSGTAGWGIAGAVMLGPLGAIGGMLLGGNAKEVVFVGNLKDGRKFMATTDGATWKKIMAVRFK